MTADLQASGERRMARSPFLHVLSCLVICIGLLFLPATSALAQSSPRAAEHEGFGRMVFDWEGPVKFSAEVVNSQLVVRFDKPISGDPKVVLKPLARYLKGVTLSPDRKMATFPLAVPVTLKSFQTSSSVVVDLVESKTPTASAAPPPAPATETPRESDPKPTAAERPQSADKSATASPAKPDTPAGPATDLMVRGGEHTGFNRLVFDWPKPVEYAVDEAGGRVTLTFQRPANVNVTALKASLPPDVGFVETKPAGKGTAVVLALPSGMRVRHFTSGPRVALDLVRPAGAAPPPRANGAPAPPLAPTLGSEEQPQALKPLAPQPVDPKAAETKPAEAKAPPNGNGTKTATAVAPEPAPPSSPEAAEGKSVSLGFAFDKPTGAAVFRRAGWLWAVFDLKAEVDTKLLKRTGGDVVLHVEQIQGFKGTAVRMITRQGYNPSIRKEGQLWVLDIHEQPLAPKVGVEIKPQLDFQDRGRVVLAMADGAPPMTLKDPEVGDSIQVVTVPGIGIGVRGGRDYPGIELLATAQGAAAVLRADNARLDVNRTSIEAAMPGGLFLSGVTAGGGTEAASAALPDAKLGADTMATAPLDLVKWLRGGHDKFVDEHRKLQSRLTFIRPDEKNAQRLEIARHYVANGFGAEALGVLRIMADADPQVVETPAFKAVRGAANFLMNRNTDAIADLSLPALKEDPRVQLVLAAATARSQPDPSKQALVLRLAPEDIKQLPRNWRMDIGEIAAKTVSAAGDAKGASRIVDAMMGHGLSRRDVGKLSYLAGLSAMAGKQYDQAITRFRDAEASESRPDRAYAARDRVELMLRLGKISPADAIGEFEKLRFAWRGEDFEYRLMKRLGQLQIAAGRYGEGLRSMHSLAANYPDNPDIANVTEEMNEAFKRLFLKGEADRLQPVAAIGLYDEFQELTPSGTQGDEMIRKLADRLAAVDLLDRASELLRHQVEFRLSGLDKAKVGARLAFLNLSDRKPGLALEALEASEIPEIPQDLAAQRRFLRVQALDDMGRSAEALALIVNDQSDQARKLRGEIYWRQKRWSDAAATLESTVEKPVGNRPLDPVMGRRLMDTAIAMTLARDERGLMRLKRNFGPLMTNTEWKEAFELLTSEAERGIIDYRRVGDKIRQVQDFQTFMSEWQKRVKTSGLSAMN